MAGEEEIIAESYNDAANKALDLIEPVLERLSAYKGRMKHNADRYLGLGSDTGDILRVDFDEENYDSDTVLGTKGFHFNVLINDEPYAIVLKKYKALLAHLEKKEGLEEEAEKKMNKAEEVKLSAEEDYIELAANINKKAPNKTQAEKKLKELEKKRDKAIAEWKKSYSKYKAEEAGADRAFNDVMDERRKHKAKYEQTSRKITAIVNSKNGDQVENIIAFLEDFS